MIVYGFEVWCARWPENRITVNDFTLGRAKACIFADARDFWPGLKFTELRGRRLGAPVTTESLARCAEYRKRPDLVAGAMVRLQGGREAVVVDDCSGANLLVLLSNGSHLSVHPCDLEVKA